MVACNIPVSSATFKASFCWISLGATKAGYVQIQGGPCCQAKVPISGRKPSDEDQKVWEFDFGRGSYGLAEFNEVMRTLTQS